MYQCPIGVKPQAGAVNRGGAQAGKFRGDTMPRPISKVFLKKVDRLQDQIQDLINEATTIDQAGHLQEMLEQMAVGADERVCVLDN